MRYVLMALVLLFAGLVEAKTGRSKRKSTTKVESTKGSGSASSSSCQMPGSDNGSLPSSVESNLSQLAIRARAMSIPTAAVNNSFQYYRNNYDKIKNKCYLTIVDFNRKSTQERFFILDVKKGSIESLKTSHGKKSESVASKKGRRGKRIGVRSYQANYFSNKMGSNASSLGVYETLGTYSGKHGYSLKLNGKDASNSNALARAIVIHKAAYVSGGGRSEGCFALEPSKYSRVINQLKGGSVIYAYHSQLGGSSSTPIAQTKAQTAPAEESQGQL